MDRPRPVPVSFVVKNGSKSFSLTSSGMPWPVSVIFNLMVRFGSSGEVSTASPIVYGITIPKNAKHRQEAIYYVKKIISEDGQKIFSDMGQVPIVPAVVDKIDNIPEELKDLVVEK